MNKKKLRYKRKFRKSEPIALGQMLDAFLLSRAKSPEQANFQQLWKHWTMVLGEDLASLAKPLGVRNKTLLVGAQSNIELQEIRMQYDEILDKVNAFMKAFEHDAFFEKVEFSLFQGKSDVSSEIKLPEHLNNILPLRPKSDKRVPIDFGENHALARCYEAYHDRLELEKKELEKKEF